MAGEVSVGGVVPVRGLEAFTGTSDQHITSQVTQLLSMGVHLQGDAGLVDDNDELAELVSAPRPRTAGPTAQALSLERLTELALNPPARGMETDAGELFTGPIELPPYVQTISESREQIGGLDLGKLSRFWWNANSRRSARSAYALLYLCLDASDDTVRAAAAAVLGVVRDHRDVQVHSVLEGYARSTEGGMAREFACIALSRDSDFDYAPDRGSDPVEGLELLPDGHESSSIVVHGTFARLVVRDKRWYVPPAELPTLIRSSCTPDLYSGADYFRWDAAYSAWQRAKGAEDLLAWCRSRGITELDTVFAHSHGGNVVLSAVARELTIKLLVLLHTPALKRGDDEWDAIVSRTGRIVDMRNPFDLVVLMDALVHRSRLTLPARLPNVRRLTPPVSAYVNTSHHWYIDPETWREHDLPDEISYERRMAG